jgi:integrase
MGLGSLSDVKLADAKDEALKLRVQRREGADPLAAKRAAKAEAKAKALIEAAAADGWTFARATDEYLKTHASSWKHPRARSIWHSPIVRYAYPIIGEMQLDHVQVEHINAVMTAAVDGGAPAVAPRIRLRIEQIFNAAIVRKQRDAVRGNPAAINLVKAIRPKARKSEDAHFRRIELAEAPATFRKLFELAQNSTPLSALVFMIATATRPGEEALKARWDEFDREKKLWTVPAKRMKGAKAHVVPLNSIALAVLERQEQIRTGDIVFAGRSGSPIHYSTFFDAAKSVGFDVGTPHSWRSIFRDWATEHGGIARETAEAALAHSLGKVERAYRRETAVSARAVAMQRYADWLLGEGSNVVAFKRA